MNTPLGLLAAACALWGVQTGYWLIAAAAAAALEAPRLLALRWNVEQAHFNRLSDFCSALVAAAGVYLFFTYGNPRALMLLFQWLPLLLLPLATAQAWGNLRQVDVAAFVWTMRRSRDPDHYAINLAYPYLAVWILAAATVRADGPVFYAGLAAIAAWALWSARPRRYPLPLWVAVIVLVAGAGYGLQDRLVRLQAWMEEAIPEWINASGSNTDPYSNRTGLGHIGSLKQDDAIVLRVRVEGAPGAPLLLHRATYNSYFGLTWRARNAPLVPRLPDAGTRWVLAPGSNPSARVTVYDYSPRGNPVLSLPRGTSEVIGLDAIGIKVNGLGTVQAESAPGFFTYVAAVDPAAANESAPEAEDLRVPRADQTLLEDIVRQARMGGLTANGAVDAVKRFLADGFGYSLYQERRAGGASALADFLLRTRAGHCEYFATATVLLLRAAGVPARYSTGFSAQEYSRLEDAYIVRVRHAHAWARAWVDGRWVDIDTTPATWAGIEEQGAAWWAPLTDLWAWLRFRLSQLGGDRDEDRTAVVVIIVALLVGLWFAWRLYRQRQLMIFGKRRPDAAGANVLQGADSEFYRVERALSGSGFARAAGETLLTWLVRIEAKPPPGLPLDALRESAALHYRYRFDPAGLPPIERARLRELSLLCLNRVTRGS